MTCDMNMNHLIKTSCVALGLTVPSFAGSEVGAIDEAHNPWSVEASLLYMYAEGDGTDSHYEGQDHEVGYRLQLGYQPDADSWTYGLEFTQFEGTTDDGGGEDGPEFMILDFTVSDDFQWNEFDLTYSLGLRYMDLEEPYSGSFDVNYEGYGPVVGLSATHEFIGPLSLYGEAEASFLFGDDSEEYVPDETFTWKIGVGLQYDFECGAYMKLGYEFQQYANMAYDTNDFSVDGLVLSVGCEF